MKKLALLFMLLLSPAALAESPVYYEQVYLSEPQALKTIFQAETIEKKELVLSAEQKTALQKRLRQKLKKESYTLYYSKKNGVLQRYALIMDEKGKHFPITFIVGLSPQAKVERVAVMVYREKRGDAIRRRRFLKQFNGKSSRDPIEVNRDIIHLTGSTISSWSVASGVRRAIALLETLEVK